MNTNFLKDLEEDISSEFSESEEVSGHYLKVVKQIKNKEMCFDDEQNVYFFEIDKYLINRHKNRLRYFNHMKRKHNLNFTNEADELFLKFLEFVYFEKINYGFFFKKICELCNIPHTLKMTKNEKIWNDFMKSLNKNVS